MHYRQAQRGWERLAESELSSLLYKYVIFLLQDAAAAAATADKSNTGPNQVRFDDFQPE